MGAASWHGIRLALKCALLDHNGQAYRLWMVMDSRRYLVPSWLGLLCSSKRELARYDMIFPLASLLASVFGLRNALLWTVLPLPPDVPCSTASPVSSPEASPEKARGIHVGRISVPGQPCGQPCGAHRCLAA